MKCGVILSLDGGNYGLQKFHLLALSRGTLVILRGAILNVYYVEWMEQCDITTINYSLTITGCY